MVQQLFKPVAALSHFRDYGISGGNPAPLFYAVFYFLPVSLHFCVYLKMALWIYFISALEPIIMTDIQGGRFVMIFAAGVCKSGILRGFPDVLGLFEP